LNAYPLMLFDKEIGDKVVCRVDMNRMPDIKNLEQAKEFIIKTMEPLKPGSVYMFYPQYASFPRVESFLVLKTSSGRLETFGIQVKAGQSTSKTTEVIPDLINHIVLIRGDAPDICKPRQDRWIYLSKPQIEDMLGYSLRPLYPANWRNCN